MIEVSLPEVRINGLRVGGIVRIEYLPVRPKRVPTRRQKRTWRRRCSRARWSQNTHRAFFSRLCGQPEIAVYDDDPSGYPAYRIRAWWQP